MRITLILVLALSWHFHFVNAEGTRQLAPNASIMIGGDQTTDIAALMIDYDEYDNFASYNNPDPNSRLYINIQDPESECIYLGFTFGHANVTGPNPARVDYEYRIKDPNGNIIYGPVSVPTTGGNINGWSDARMGPMQLVGAGGYDAMVVSPADLTSAGWSGDGDYYIEFLNTVNGDHVLIDFWDITVADCSSTPVEKPGRLWSYNWAIFAINDFGFPNRPFNGAFYVCAPDPQNPDAAFITKIDFNGAGFRPAAFNIAFNSFGVSNTGNIMQDRRSIENTNATQPEYAVFLNDPVDLCITAEAGNLELLGVTRCGSEDFCIKFVASQEGQIDLLLDFDGPDDMYTPGTDDVMLTYTVAADEVGMPTCIYWDGHTGLGTMIPEDIDFEIPVVIGFAQGIYHFPIYDAELMTNGFRIEAVRPAADQPLLFYDDSQISVPSGSGEPAVQLSGCDLPCHRWTNYVDGDTPGFGNLHTINSWWFSQLIIRQSLFNVPVYMECEIDGAATICDGDTTVLTWVPEIYPEGAIRPIIASSSWSGPGIIGPNDGTSVSITGPGVYTVDVSWLTKLGDTCSTSCAFEIALEEPSTGTLDTVINYGDTVEINGEKFAMGGQFVQVLTASNGCDSILLINISTINTVVLYNLDSCESNFLNGSGLDYSEFVAEYPEPVTCAQFDASIIYRVDPEINRHSCTPGVNGSIAMCVSSVEDCSYDPGNDKSILFELLVEPSEDTAVAITSLSFYERAPENYDWINGNSGPNNYPTRYGVRVLKDGVEIFRQEDLEATTAWSEEIFDFNDLDEFVVDTPSLFQFELLAYCIVGNGAVATAWDIDEVRIRAGCVPPPPSSGLIGGDVFSWTGQKLGGVNIFLDEKNAPGENRATRTDNGGNYEFSDVPFGRDYYLTALDNSDYRTGVSTLDLVMIQQHLLGLKPFDRPEKYLAADANRSGSVSAIDIVELRKLILGIYLKLPDSDSWRFGAAEQEGLGGDPFSFKEITEIDQYESDISDLDILGIKVGDVNGDYLPGMDSAPVGLRSGGKRMFKINDSDVDMGELVTVPIFVDEASAISGFQLALNIENAGQADVTSSALNLDGTYLVEEDRVSTIQVQC